MTVASSSAPKLQSWRPSKVHYITYVHDNKVQFYCESARSRSYGWLSYAGETEDALLFENEKGVARASTAKVEVTCKGCKKFWMKF